MTKKNSAKEVLRSVIDKIKQALIENAFDIISVMILLADVQQIFRFLLKSDTSLGLVRFYVQEVHKIFLRDRNRLIFIKKFHFIFLMVT